MVHLHVPAIVVFLPFTLVNGLMAFYLWRVMWRSRARLDDPAATELERLRAWMGVITVLPFSAFSFGFLFFAYKTLQALLGILFK